MSGIAELALALQKFDASAAAMSAVRDDLMSMQVNAAVDGLLTGRLVSIVDNCTFNATGAVSTLGRAADECRRRLALLEAYERALSAYYEALAAYETAMVMHIIEAQMAAATGEPMQSPAPIPPVPPDEPRFSSQMGT